MSMDGTVVVVVVVTVVVVVVVGSVVVGGVVLVGVGVVTGVVVLVVVVTGAVIDTAGAPTSASLLQATSRSAAASATVGIPRMARLRSAVHLDDECIALSAAAAERCDTDAATPANPLI